MKQTQARKVKGWAHRSAEEFAEKTPRSISNSKSVVQLAFEEKSMQQEKEHFLNLKTSPARLTAEEAAWFLGFSTHEIPILLAGGLLKPLGRPPSNGPKYFGAAVLEELRRDQKWLARASDAIVEFWKAKNDRRGGGRQDSRHVNRPEMKAKEQA